MDNNTARNFAESNHKNQKYGSHPYIYHLDMVVDALTLAGETSDALVQAGYLHDVIEDTHVTYEILAEIFGPKVAGIVQAVSNKNTHEETFKAIQNYGIDACTVKVADRVTNLSQSIVTRNFRMLKKYVSRQDALFTKHVLSGVTNKHLIAKYLGLIAIGNAVIDGIINEHL